MKIIVGQHKLEIVKEPVNEREIDISKCEFEFDEAITSEYVKEAYFTLEGNTYKQIILNDECDIPSEVLVKKGTVEIGVVAFLVEDEEEIKRYNPSPAYFNTWVGSLKDNAENSEPVTPTDKEQMEQALQEGLNDIDDKLGEVDDKMLVVDGKIEDIDTAITQTNNLNIDVSDKVGKDVTVTLTKKDATTKVVTLSDGTSLMFNWSGTSLGIKTDEDEEYTYVDLQGIQGPVGPMGAPFTIKKTYATIQLMIADYDNMNVGDYVMIDGNIEQQDNATLWVKEEIEDPTYKWHYLADFSGATGIQGPTGLTPNIQIGTVVSGATPSVTRTGTNENPVLNFTLVKGDKGDTGNTGATGNGISSIAKTGTSSLVDTYTITYTNGNTSTFTVTNGNGIASITKTASAGLIDTYTITFTDGTTSTFNITNGADGDVTQEYVDEENERLKSVFNILPKVSDSGESIELENTGDTMLYKVDLKGNTSQEVVQGEVGLEEENTSIYVDDVNEDKENYITLKGNTYQDSTTGKNLFDKSTISSVAKGTNNNGVITSNTMSNEGINLMPYFSNMPVSDGDTIYISADIKLNRGSTGSINNINDGVIAGFTKNIFPTLSTNYQRYQTSYTYSSNTNITKILFQFFNVTGTIKISNIMISKNSNADYEPYTNGASPNPDYPQEIEVVTGLNEVKVEGKNLLNIPDTTLTLNNVTLVSSGGKISISGTASATGNISIPISLTLPAGTYVHSTNRSQIPVSSNMNINGDFNINYKSDSKVQTLNEEKTYTRYVVQVVSGITYNLTIEPQLEKGSQATTYEAYKGQTYEVNLGSIELCKIGTYQDYFYKNNGNWYKHSEIGKYTFTGNEDVINFGDSTYEFRITTNLSNIKDGTANIYCLCDKLVGSTGNSMWNKKNTAGYNLISAGPLSSNFLVILNDITTSSGISSALSTLKPVIYYVLSTPTETQITDTTLVNQLEALYQAQIHSTTHINTETSNLLPYINLKYNVVTASPSPDRASEVEVVKGNNTITISNEDGTKTQTFNVNLGSLEFCKIGDYQDYFYYDKSGDKWYKYKSVEKLVLNGTENYDMSSNGNVFYLNSAITNITSIENMKCNYYLYDAFSNLYNANTDYGISFNTSNTKIAIRDKDISSVNDFKTWLSNNNTIIYYPLSTPTTTQITDQLLVSQLDELQKAMSYYDKTIITQTNADKPFILDVVAIRDLQDIFNL